MLFFPMQSSRQDQYLLSQLPVECSEWLIKSTGIGRQWEKCSQEIIQVFLVPFLIAAVMKTAQGSSTVAIITTASFIAPMLPILGLDNEWGKLFAMLAMGSGSMIVSHANDSYFWVVTNFGGISVMIHLKFIPHQHW